MAEGEKERRSEKLTSKQTKRRKKWERQKDGMRGRENNGEILEAECARQADGVGRQAGRQTGWQTLRDNEKGTQTEQVPYLQKNAVFSAGHQFQEQVCRLQLFIVVATLENFVQEIQSPLMKQNTTAQTGSSSRHSLAFTTAWLRCKKYTILR